MNELLREALASRSPGAIALAHRLASAQKQPYHAFRPRPDCKEELDEQESFVNERFPGVAVALGGTGSGKSTAAAFKTAKLLRETPPPRPNCPFWVLSQNMAMASGVGWAEKLSQFITPDLIENISWHSQARGQPNAVVLKKHQNGNNWLVEIMSADMDRQRLAARSCFGYWIDEPVAHSIWAEVHGRTRDYDCPGSRVYSLTPLVPTPELKVIFEQPTKNPDWRFYRMNSAKNTALAPGFVEKFVASEIPELRQTRLTGDFARLAGQAFKREWFRFYDDLEGESYKLGNQVVSAKHCHRLVTVDLAISTKTSADWTVAQVWDVSPKQQMILVNEWRVKAEGPAIIAGLKRLQERYNPALFAVESVAYQMLMVQMLRQEGLPVKAITTGGKDKMARSARAQVKADSGQIWLPRTAAWVEPWLSEVCSFPYGAFDDRVDALAYAAILASRRSIHDDEDTHQDARKRIEEAERRAMAG